MFIYKFLGGNMFSFGGGKYLRVEFLGQVVSMCSIRNCQLVF